MGKKRTKAHQGKRAPQKRNLTRDRDRVWSLNRDYYRSKDPREKSRIISEIEGSSRSSYPQYLSTIGAMHLDLALDKEVKFHEREHRIINAELWLGRAANYQIDQNNGEFVMRARTALANWLLYQCLVFGVAPNKTARDKTIENNLEHSAALSQVFKDLPPRDSWKNEHHRTATAIAGQQTQLSTLTMVQRYDESFSDGDITVPARYSDQNSPSYEQSWNISTYTHGGDLTPTRRIKATTKDDLPIIDPDVMLVNPSMDFRTPWEIENERYIIGPHVMKEIGEAQEGVERSSRQLTHRDTALRQILTGQQS